MKISFQALLWLAAGLHLSGIHVAGQPSVYSGVFAFNEGSLNSLSKQQAVSNFVNDAQKDVSIINVFTSWTSGSSTNGTTQFPTAGMDYIRGHGSIPLLTWEPWNPGLGTVQSFTLANIASGVYDSYITNWAAAAKTWGHPFFLRPGHEMNGNWYPWCASVNGNTPAQYISMWRHVHDIFTGIGATNVTWVWCVNFISPSFTPIDQLYPGDNYVDWISVDGYNRLANSWQDFSVLAAPTVAQLTNIAPGKPVMVAETGCNQNINHDKSQWCLNVLTNYLPVIQPRIKAWVYFNSTNTSDGNDWRITVPTSAAPGYQKGIALSYYDTNRYGAISSSPIQPLLNDATTTDTMAPFISIVSPGTNSVAAGAIARFVASASDKSGVAKVVFSLNGTTQQTNTSPPYQFSWPVPASGGVSYTVAAVAFDNAGNSAASTVQVVSSDTGIVTVTNSPIAPTIVLPPPSGTNLVLQAGSQAGFEYVLQATPQLAPANWTAIQTNAGGGLVVFTIPINLATQQFFRIAVQ